MVRFHGEELLVGEVRKLGGRCLVKDMYFRPYL